MNDEEHIPLQIPCNECLICFIFLKCRSIDKLAGKFSCMKVKIKREID